MDLTGDVGITSPGRKQPTQVLVRLGYTPAIIYKRDRESEVADWFRALDEDDQARVGHVNRLGGLGPLLDELHTEQLDRTLRDAGRWRARRW